MATTLPAILIAQTSIPRQIETKIPQLPKLSGVMTKLAGMLPAGPAVFPEVAMKSPTLPPLRNVFKGPPMDGSTAGLNLAPRSARGTTTYASLDLAPTTGGAQRGTIEYVG